LFDGHGGQQIAELTPQFAQYFVGGPPAPWLHYGTQHLIVTHDRMAVYDARTGRALPVLDARSYGGGGVLAYDEAGTRLAALKGTSSHVVLHTLPSGRMRELAFGLKGSAIAISPDGERIALQRGRAVEIRTADGALLQRHAGASRSARNAKRAPVVRHAPSHVTQSHEATLRFSRDGRRIARFVADTGWRIWEPGTSDVEHLAADRPLDDVADFAAPWPADWTIEADSRSVFTHQPTGTRIALPVCGPWVSNPADPRILACDRLHIALRGAV
jgi:dipeptidyl aminopeptidase/acylaminoacyl peptidase